MNKFLLVSALSVLFAFGVSSSVAAGQARRNVGCGLGSLLWESRADRSAVLQAFQATTNGTFGSQTFGVTSGTSKCERASQFVMDDRLNEFVVANMDNLAKEMARGSGETLDTFAALMHIPAEKRPEFFQRLQADFARIFTSEQVVHASVLDNVVTVSAANGR